MQAVTSMTKSPCRGGRWHPHLQELWTALAAAQETFDEAADAATTTGIGAWALGCFRFA
jgi:hypothetical protein